MIRPIDGSSWMWTKLTGAGLLLLVVMHFDPVAGVPVPCGMRGFIKLLIDPPDGMRALDVSLPGVAYEWQREGLLPDYRATEIFRNIVFESPFHDVAQEISGRVRDAIDTNGILYAGIRVRFSASGGVINRSRIGDVPLPFMTGHAVAIVGWIEQGEDLYFVYRETFGEYDTTSSYGGPAYRVYPIFGFSEVYSFQPPRQAGVLRGLGQSRRATQEAGPTVLRGLRL